MSEIYADLTLFDRADDKPEKVIIVGPMLRDQFAMAALTGFMSSDLADISKTEEIAERAYEYADAMLKARKAK